MKIGWKTFRSHKFKPQLTCTCSACETLVSLGILEVLVAKICSCPALTFFMTFLQVTRPDGKPETLGLVVLDEPMAKQSDPTGTPYTSSWTRI